MSGTAASTKVWRRVGAHARDALLKSLTVPEIRTILADVARTRAAALAPGELMRRWREDRFVTPSASDPRVLARLQARLWDALPADFTGVELSPLTALGSVTQLSGVSQNRVITTMRGTEVVFDPVHPLALEASRLRRSGRTRVHLAACQRVAHAWDDGTGQHETRFALVSSAPDAGGFATEADLIDLHVDYWRDVMGTLVPGGRVELVVAESTLEGHLAERGTRDGLIVVDGADGPWRNPYSGASFRLVDADGAILGDGGLVTWTQTLTRNRKDRCLVSGIAVDPLLEAFAREP